MCLQNTHSTTDAIPIPKSNILLYFLICQEIVHLVKKKKKKIHSTVVQEVVPHLSILSFANKIFRNHSMFIKQLKVLLRNSDDAITKHKYIFLYEEIYLQRSFYKFTNEHTVLLMCWILIPSSMDILLDACAWVLNCCAVSPYFCELWKKWFQIRSTVLISGKASNISAYIAFHLLLDVFFFSLSLSLSLFEMVCKN